MPMSVNTTSQPHQKIHSCPWAWRLGGRRDLSTPDKIGSHDALYRAMFSRSTRDTSKIAFTDAGSSVGRLPSS